MKRLSQKGDAGVWLLLAIILVLVAGTGYVVWEKQGGDDDEVAYTAAPAQDCQGTWYDTHVHVDETDFSHKVAERMRANDVGCSLVFAHVDLDDTENSILELREELSPNPGRFVVFADVIGDDLKAVTRDKLDKLFTANPKTFKGIGENAFYRPPQTGTSLLAEPWPTIFKFAAEKDLYVMLHVTDREAADLETMLARYPGTKVLLHHRELAAKLPEMLRRHKNLYYTLDTTNLTTLTTTNPQTVLFYPDGQGNAEQFLAKFEDNRQALLDKAVDDWLPVFEAAPDRVMWGTDVSMEWHADPEVYEKLVRFSQDFTERLPEKYRDGYRFKNALQAFGKGVTLEPLDDQEIKKLDESEDDQP